MRPILLMLLGGAGLLLLIACTNVANLLLVRSESRRREMAVRSALGASRLRLMRQFVTEGFVLVAAASSLGLLSALWLMRGLKLLIPSDLVAWKSFLENLGLNWHVGVFAGSICVFAMLLFAMTPALRIAGAGVSAGLAEGSRGSAGLTWRRVGARLLVVELTTAVVLLVGAALLDQSLYRLLHVELNFQPDHLATMMLAAPQARYGKDPQAVALEREIHSRLLNLPGVQAAGTSSTFPVSFNGNTNWIRIAGHPYNGEHNDVNEREVSSTFFQTLGVKLLRGRFFTEADDATRPKVILINQALARKYFPGEDPIGKQIGDIQLSPQSLCEIVGIVDDLREGPLDASIEPAEYFPANQSPDVYRTLVVRTAQSPESVLPQIAATIRQIDPGIVVSDIRTMQQRIEDSPSAYMHRSSAWLLGGFATLALLLGVIGLYGVVAYSVSQRTREIGVRMALGAERRAVYAMILKEAGLLTAIGIAAGLVCAMAAASTMRKFLFGIEPWDVPTLAGVVTVLALAALIATYLPARRAASVNPVEALRME